MTELIKRVANLVESTFKNEGTGHDWYHINRVRKLALRMAESEGADKEIVELAALLHDIADHKFHDHDLSVGPEKAKAIILEYGGTSELAKKVSTIVSETSFKGAGVETPVSSLESAVVQDADRLDALGAIGIARAFAYGGSKNRLLYDPDQAPVHHDDFEKYATSVGTTVNHFYEKLLLLKDRMHTETGRKLAVKRHEFMEVFLREFFSEWEGYR